MQTVFKTIGFFFMFLHLTFAQVGINTTNPKAQLDISASNTAIPLNTDGILIPRVAAFPATNPGANQQSLLIYLTTTLGSNLPGFYFWDNTTTSWKALAELNKVWKVTGNSGTVDGVNFIGTTDNVPLNFRVNNQKSGRIDQNLNNVFFGYFSGMSNTIGSFNTANGSRSFMSNTTGSYNSAFGFFTLNANTTGFNNSAFGYYALKSNVFGSNNSAFGFNCLSTNINGNNNTAFGNSAMQSNNSGSFNTAVGYYALRLNTISNFNTSVGYYSLQNNTTGDANTAIGYFALNSNVNGYSNVSVGYNSLFSNVNGIGNVAVGKEALALTTSGYYNVAIGAESGRNITTGSYNITLGAYAHVADPTASKQIQIGVETDKANYKTRISSYRLNLSGIPTFDNDATAGTAGLVTNDVYKTSTGELRIKL